MGGSAPEAPTPPENRPVQGLRASDAERDQVVAQLRNEFVAGRLSHDTFLYRVNAVLESRRQSELPPMVADLPSPPAGNALTRWVRGAWSRVTGTPQKAAGNAVAAPTFTPQASASPAQRQGRGPTTSMRAAPDHRAPFVLQFPRGAGSQFSIGRDATCDLAIADMTVSRRHAQLERTTDGWVLSDLESTNGTRVNGWRVRGKVSVGPGDLVSFGDLEVVLMRGDDPPALLPPQHDDPPAPAHGGGLAPS